MVTKLYFHAANSTYSNLPTTEQSTLTSDKDWEAQTVNHAMDTRRGGTNTSISVTSLGNTTLKNNYITKFVSPKLNQTSIAANTWTYNFANSQNSANANFPVSGTNQPIYINCYVWRTSTQTKVGTILDGNCNSEFDEPSSISSERSNHGTFSGSAVTGITANDDVIVFEAWAQTTQAAGTGYNLQYFFDGGTETLTKNTVVADHASFLSTPEDISLCETKLYFHAATSGLSNLPTAEQSTLTADDTFEGSDTTNRTMNSTIGTAQTSLANASLTTNTLKNYYVTRFVSDKINQTSIPASTWVYSFAAQESSTSANFPVSTTNQPVKVVCYIWRTSTQTKVATIIDGNSASTCNEPASGVRSQYTTFSGAAASSLLANDDVIIFEVWFAITQASTTSYTQTFYYDGTTETNNSTATPTNHASYIYVPERIFGGVLTRISLSRIYQNKISARVSLSRIYKNKIATRVSLSRIYKNKILTRVSLSRIYKNKIIQRISLSRIYKNQILIAALTRISLSRAYKNKILNRVGASALKFDGIDDYINCGDDSALWSQALTKFSFSIWIYPLLQTGNRYIVHHGQWSTAQAFGLYHYSTNNFGLETVDNSTGTHTAIATYGQSVLNKWIHVTCTYDSTLGSANVKIYLDGVLGGSSNLTQTLNLSISMSLSHSTTDFQGYQKDFRWFTNKALTQTEIDNIFANSPTAPTPDYWLKMNEGTGNPVDTITGTKTGTLTNGATWGPTAPAVLTGRTRSYINRILQRVGAYAIKFDGVDDSLDCGNDATLWSQSLTKFSFSFWVKCAAIPLTNRTLVNHGYSTNQSFMCHRDNGNGEIIRFRIRNSAGTDIIAGILPSTTILNRWIHVTCVYDSTLGSANLKIYGDGVLGGTTANLTSAINLSATLAIDGTTSSATGYQPGNFKDFRWYTTKALTQAEIDNIRVNSPNAPTPDYWLKMTENTGNPVDTISGTKSGALTNGAKWISDAPDVLTGRTQSYINRILNRISLSRIYKNQILAAALTRISLSRIYQNKIQARVSLSRTYKNRILLRLSLSRIYKNKIRARISLNRIYQNKIRARVSLSRVYKNKIAARVTLSRIYANKIRSRVSLSRAYKNRILNRISLSRIYKNRILLRISLSRIYKNRILNRISLSRIYKNRILVRVSNSRIYKNKIIGRISLSRIYKNRIRARVSLTRAYKNRIIARVSLSRIYKNRVLNRISLSRIYKNRILLRVSLSRIYKNKMIGRVSLARKYINQIILTGFTRITLQRTYKNKIQARVSNQRVYKNRMLNRVSLSRIYKNRIFARISLSRIYKNRILNRISLSRVYRNRIFVRISLTRIYRNRIQVRVSLSRIYKNRMAARVSLSRVYRNRILARVSLIRIYRNKIMLRVSLSRIYRNRVLGRISLSRIYKNKIAARVSLSRIYRNRILQRISLSRIYKNRIFVRVSLSRVYKNRLFARVSLTRTYVNKIQSLLTRISLQRTYINRIQTRVSLTRIYINAIEKAKKEVRTGFNIREKIPRTTSFLRGLYDRTTNR